MAAKKTNAKPKPTKPIKPVKPGKPDVTTFDDDPGPGQGTPPKPPGKP